MVGGEMGDGWGDEYASFACSRLQEVFDPRYASSSCFFDVFSAACYVLCTASHASHADGFEQPRKCAQ